MVTLQQLQSLRSGQLIRICANTVHAPFTDGMLDCKFIATQPKENAGQNVTYYNDIKNYIVVVRADWMNLAVDCERIDSIEVLPSEAHS